MNSYWGFGRFVTARSHGDANARPSLAERLLVCPPVRSKLLLRVLIAALVLVIIALLSYVASRRSVDFPVYHYGARKMLSGTGPIYGPESGIGWPQVYRYPPLFLVLFIPFALLPLRLAAIIWAALKFLALGFLARALFSRLRTRGLAWQFLSFLPALPYLAVEFHYGNVQFFIFALVAAAFLCLDEQPVLAAFALALAISVKVWPLFFMPYLIVRRRIAVASPALALSAGLTLLPASYFGWHANGSLLHKWASQEFGVAATAGEPAIIGFPSQSMHGVLMRLLVSLDYTKLTDSNYPKLNVAAFDARAIELLWLILASAGCTGLFVLARRQPQSDNLTTHAVAFCGLLLLQPFTQVGDLVILFWPIAIAVAALHDDADLPSWARAALYIALSLMVLKPLLPHRATQRLLQVLGADFAAISLLTAGLVGKCLSKVESVANHPPAR